MAEIRNAPTDLSGEALAFWEAVTSSYQLRPDETRLLEEACREIDLIERLNNALKPGKATAAPMTKGSMGQKVVNPLYQEVRQHRLALNTLLKQLKLPSVEENAGANEKAAPSDTSAAARRAALARWGTRG